MYKTEKETKKVWNAKIYILINQGEGKTRKQNLDCG